MIKRGGSKWLGLASGGALAASLTGDVRSAWACHDDPDLPGYDEDGFSVGLTFGVAFGPSWSLSYGLDVRAHRQQRAALVRLEGRGVSSLRVVGAVHLVSDDELAAEVGVAYHSARRGSLLAPSAGLHLGFGAYDGGGGLQLAGTIPFLGDTANYDVNAHTILVPDQIELCLASGRRLRVGDRCVLPDVARLAEDRDSQVGTVPQTLWLEDARAEHASIPAFERMAVELRLAGAPDALVDAARRARDDEAHHARLCSDLADVPHWMLPMDSAMAKARWRRPCTELAVTLASEAWIDGCLGEGIAAACADDAKGLPHPRAARAQAMIARDERRHAELAWTILEWLWHGGDADVRDRIAQLSATDPSLPEGVSSACDSDRLAAAGRLDHESVRRAAQRETDRALERLRTLVRG